MHSHLLSITRLKIVIHPRDAANTMRVGTSVEKSNPFDFDLDQN